jgi:hypothetical protein
MGVHDQTSAPSITITLVPEASSDRGNIASLSVPEGEQAIVRLQLALMPNQSGSYRAELLTVDGKTVFRAESIIAPESASAQIDFDVPGRLLRSGDYQIRLARNKAEIKENLGRYYFRVR